MKIFIVCSKSFYPQVEQIKQDLEKMGHQITPPNGYSDPETEEHTKTLTQDEYRSWKGDMIKKDGKIIAENDAILVINLNKNGQDNYIGRAAFLEMFKAFDLDKKIFLWNPIPESSLKDEIEGFSPIVINQDLALIKE